MPCILSANKQTLAKQGLRFSVALLTLCIALAGSFFSYHAVADQAERKPPAHANVRSSIEWPYYQRFPSGPKASITDVAGVRVGQVTWHEESPLAFHTGVTVLTLDAAMLTNGQGTLATSSFPAQFAILNGNGEVTGTHYLQSKGRLNGPIALTGTRSVGLVWEGVLQWMLQRYGHTWDSLLPIVAECWDGQYSTADKTPITPEAVTLALNKASDEPVQQGKIGSGAGLRTFGLRGGLGSASRLINWQGKVYTVGVLVNSNHSRFDSLKPEAAAVLQQALGKPLPLIHQQDQAESLYKTQASLLPEQTIASQPRQGSIITLIATDAPLGESALQALAQRSVEGVAALGSFRATSSGDFALAFSIKNATVAGQIVSLEAVLSDSDAFMNPLYQATIEAVVEAQLNAIIAAHQAE